MENRYYEIVKIIASNENIAQFGEFGNGASDEWVKRAQERLKVQFPPSYIWWLKNYGGGEIHGNEIYSIYEIDFDTVVGGDIVYMNELNRKNLGLSIHQLVIQENDQGEIYYFDLSQIDVNGEAPVYCDITGDKYANDFFDFLKKKIEE